jgi:hypothetical protein
LPRPVRRRERQLGQTSTRFRQTGAD